jgi:hypothetical protein
MWSGLVSYAAFTVFAFLGPGISLQRLFGLPVDRALIVPLGGGATAGLYWLSLASGRPGLFPFLLLALHLPLLRRGRGDGTRAEPAPAGPAWAAIALVLAVLALTAYPLHRLDSHGSFLLDPEHALAADTAFHVGVTRELVLGYPPQVPGIAGFPLHYHLGTDLVRAAALRWAGVDPYDSINRFDVTLWAIALVVAIRAATRAMGASRTAVAIAGFTVLAGDLSFLFAANPQAHWWTDLLRGNILLSLVLANPVIPALTMALGVLVAFARHDGDGRRGWLVLAVGLALAVAFFKVFLGAHLALGLGVAALLRRDARCVMAAAAALLSTAVLAVSDPTRSVAVTLAPLDLVNVTRDTLSLPRLAGPALLMWSLPWLVASLGLRVLGLRPALAALRQGSSTAVAMATMALTGWPLGLLFKVAPPDAVAGQKAINDASFLVEQSGPLLWIFTAIALARLAQEGRRLPVAAAAALLAVPSSLHFVTKRALTPPDPLPAATVRAMRALADVSAPGDVILQRPSARYPPAPVVLIGRRVPYERFTPYLTQFAPKAALEERHEEVHRFFERVTDADEASAIAQRLGARHLCLYPHDPRPRFDVDRLYEPVFEEAGTRVYRRR